MSSVLANATAALFTAEALSFSIFAFPASVKIGVGMGVGAKVGAGISVLTVLADATSVLGETSCF
ncbi:hypothetical protein EHS13_18650 [Paenibacillus psychroresistens]|uniref:Uncharacterized protein n=1 Tax=Paenibacillus psychroresistens TaxID=1778678 RepID=A0A6B8RLX3_9BACL|nr:hypothetical protein [Paenibacillus psychroresistens]QGQ96754.1 hypothetical protein EHS13_18650 [Paenibacillus psychroresistens]